MAWAWAAEFLPRLGTAILILAVGYVAATWAGTGVARLVGRIDPTAAGIKNPVTPQTAPAAGLTGGAGSLPPAPPRPR